MLKKYLHRDFWIRYEQHIHEMIGDNKSGYGNGGEVGHLGFMSCFWVVALQNRYQWTDGAGQWGIKELFSIFIDICLLTFIFQKGR